MKITFLVPTSPHPVGGVTANYEWANGLCRRGHDVTVTHIDLMGYGVRSTDAMPWARFDPGVRQLFLPTVDYDAIPDGDFIFVLSGVPPRAKGLPLMILQGYGVFPKKVDAEFFRQPFPKILTTRWLVEVGKRLGVPEHELVHVTYGLDFDKYRQKTPVEDRPPLVSMVYRNHPTKGPAFGLRALVEAQRRVPDMRAAVFGQLPAKHEMPPFATYYTNPPQETIVDDIYNQSRAFICSSVVEGFGLPSIEAIACGCPVATTANGGSDDYPIHGETALVCPPKDPAAMAEHIVMLLTDESLRRRLVANGQEFIRRFDWDVNARVLEDFLHAYGAEPDYYQLPAREV